MLGDDGRNRTDRVKAELLAAAEAYRILLDHDPNLTQVVFLVQFLGDGGIRRVIVKPESYRECPRGGPEKR